VPTNGEINQTFGVFRNVCCGQEIIIREGATFPDCTKHPKLSTVWKPIEVDTAEIIIINNKTKAEPAA
jgi:hypothetical protein